MRARFLLSFALFLAVGGLILYCSQRPPLLASDLRVALLPPAQPTLTATASRTATWVPSPSLTPTPTGTPTLVAPPTRLALHTPKVTPTRVFPPALLTPVTPQVTALPDASFGPVLISAAILTDTASAAVVTDTFRTGHFTLYGVFTYTRMTPGAVWAQVWLRGGTTPVRGETALWGQRSSGRAFVFCNPQEGWLPGDYEVDLFIEQRLVQVARFRVLP